MSARFPKIPVPRLLAVVFPAVLLCAPGTLFGAETTSTEEWNIQADKLIHFDNPKSVVAEGNVVLIKKEKLPANPPKKAEQYTSWSELLGEDTEEVEITGEEILEPTEAKYKTAVTIHADWMSYDTERETIKAKGNVEIISEGDHLYASQGILSLATEKGSFDDATVIRQEQAMHLEGKTIEKTGEDTYKIATGWVITCKLQDGQEPPWSLASAETDIRQNGYAVLKHARFNIAGIPVFYSPYMIIPVKNTRQTGFLFPEFSLSTNSGFGIDIPLFINISDSTDLTLFPEYYVKRGVMPGLEFRSVTGVGNQFWMTASYLDDALSDPSETEYYSDTGYTHDNSDRYWLRAKADMNFGEWQSRLDVDVVSDQDYLDEFDTGITGFERTHDRYLSAFGRGFQNQTDTQRQNSFKLLNSWEDISLEINFLAIDDVSTYAATTDTPLWKLPSVDASGSHNLGESTFTVAWDANYVDYWREDGVGGHRVDLHPTLSTSVPLSPYLESRAEIGIRDTFYIVQTYGDAEWDNDDMLNRVYPEFSAEVATTWERSFYKSGTKQRSFSHQFRPFVSYGYIPEVDQDDLPYWDSTDSISEANAITYGVDNFINTFSDDKNGNGSASNYLIWKLSQSYDLREDVSERFGDIYSEFAWYPWENSSISYKMYYDPYDNAFTSHTLEGTLYNSRGDYLTFDYSKKDDENIEQLNGSLLAHLIYGWSFAGYIEHSIVEDETVQANAALIYNTACWAVRFETVYTPEETTYTIMFSLANIGASLGFDPTSVAF